MDLASVHAVVASEMGSQGGASIPSPELVEQFRRSNALQAHVDDQATRIKELEGRLQASAAEVCLLKSQLVMSSADAEGARDEAKQVQGLRDRDRERHDRAIEAMQQVIQDTIKTLLGDSVAAPPDVVLSSTASRPDTSNISDVVAPRMEKATIQVKAQEVLSSYFGTSFANLTDGIAYFEKHGHISGKEFSKLSAKFSKFSDERFERSTQLIVFLKKMNREASGAKPPDQVRPTSARSRPTSPTRTATVKSTSQEPNMAASGAWQK